MTEIINELGDVVQCRLMNVSVGNEWGCDMVKSRAGGHSATVQQRDSSGGCEVHL